MKTIFVKRLKRSKVLNMIMLKSCCLCFSPKTGTVILGCLGIVLAVLAMVPHAIMLKDNEYYVRQYVKTQINLGRDYTEGDIPGLNVFTRSMLASGIAIDTIIILASILVVAGVAAERRFLLVPWLFFGFLGILTLIILMVSVAIKFVNDVRELVLTLLIFGPFLGAAIYCWLAVYSTFHRMRKELGSITQPPLASGSVTSSLPFARPCSMGGKAKSRHLNCQYQSLSEGPDSANGGRREAAAAAAEQILNELPSLGNMSDEVKSLTLITQSASMSSFDSARKNLGAASPPPPYDTVAVDIDAEKIALASGVEDKDLTYFQKEKIMKRLSINRNRSGINNLSQKRSQSCDNLNISSRSRIKIGRRQSDQTGKVSSADQIVVQFPSQTKCENPNSIETVAEEA